jgi:hypothetical protein
MNGQTTGPAQRIGTFIDARNDAIDVYARHDMGQILLFTSAGGKLIDVDHVDDLVKLLFRAKWAALGARENPPQEAAA